MSFTRREFVHLGITTAAVAAASRFFVVDSYAQTSGKYADLFHRLDDFVEQYMRSMNSPGMTMVLADRDGVQRVVTYGFNDTETKTRVTPENLFEIGSISKSFVANCVLQLHQEGKLDLHKPITEYLPWFRIESEFEPITIHHMLSHTTGLPDDMSVFPSDPTEKHRVAYAPGKNFHYSNLCFTTLGYLLWTLEGQPLSEVIRKRVLEPLGMTQTEPFITLDIRPKMAKSYSSFQNDRPYPRYGRLCEAEGLIMDQGAGCVASSPRDMGLYIQMWANRGKGPHSPLLSEETFAMFSKPYINAEEDFGPNCSYGYGVAIEPVDGHTVLRHTGGMTSFASAIQVDIDAGVGAFASINAMQNYRPNPPVRYAMQMMRAQNESKSLPAPPALSSPSQIKNAADYAGTYKNSEGRALEIVAEGDKPFLLHHGQRISVEALTSMEGGGSFVALHPEFDRFELNFERAEEHDPKSPVVEVTWGPEWFTNAKYTGPKHFDYPKEWETYVGHYRNDSPWIGSAHVFILKGKLVVDGAELKPGANGIFHMPDIKKDVPSPEWVRFYDVVNGKAMHMKYSGTDLWRVMTP